MLKLDSRIKGVIFASITALMWGFLAIALKLAANVLDPVTIVWFRFLTAFFILFIYILITKPINLRILKKPPLLLLLAGLGLGINYVAFLYGLDLTSPGSAQVIIQIGPISLGMIGFFFFREKISVRQAVGFMIAGTGLMIFYRDNIAGITGDESMYNMGIIWVIVAAMAWVAYAILQKNLLKQYPASQLNLVLFGLPIVIFMPFIRPSGLLDLTFNSWLLLIYLGLNTLIAYGSLAMALKFLEANKVSIIITSNPILTFIIMAVMAYYEVSWIEPEVLSTTGMLAVVLVIGGGIMAVAFSKPQHKRSIQEFFQKRKN